MAVVDGDSSSFQTASRVPYVSMGHIHDVGHVERAMTSGGLITQLLEVDVTSRRHEEEEHVSRHCVDKSNISDLATGHQEVVSRAESITGKVIDLDRVSSDYSQLGLTARQPHCLDDAVGCLQLGLQDHLVRDSTRRVEGQDMAVFQATHCQEVLIAGVGDQGEDSEWDWSR